MFREDTHIDEHTHQRVVLIANKVDRDVRPFRQLMLMI